MILCVLLNHKQTKGKKRNMQIPTPFIKNMFIIMILGVLCHWSGPSSLHLRVYLWLLRDD